MKFWTVYDKATGEVIKTVLAPMNHSVPVSDGEAVIEGQFEDDKYHIKDGQPKERGVVAGPKGEKTPKPMNAGEARLTRDKMLSNSDWTQLPDAQVDQEAWAVYRQSLRDITTQDGFPENIEWPQLPRAKKEAHK